MADAAHQPCSPAPPHGGEPQVVLECRQGLPPQRSYLPRMAGQSTRGTHCPQHRALLTTSPLPSGWAGPSVQAPCNPRCCSLGEWTGLWAGGFQARLGQAWPDLSHLGLFPWPAPTEFSSTTHLPTQARHGARCGVEWVAAQLGLVCSSSRGAGASCIQAGGAGSLLMLCPLLASCRPGPAAEEQCFGDCKFPFPVPFLPLTVYILDISNMPILGTRMYFISKN